jgi:CDP-glucose 4,6-dehydratase
MVICYRLIYAKEKEPRKGLVEMLNLSFYKGKHVLVTGHTGFKGVWLCKILTLAGANISGYALEPSTQPNLFDLCDISRNMNSIIGDIRDLPHLLEVFTEIKPEIVFHLAAQPLVRESYKNPVYSYETNIMGTVNILECIRQNSCVKSFLNITTDKVYENTGTERSYCEEDRLCGFDPYSNSKSCSELVTYSYKNSFFQDGAVAISTSRAGNVIGGGDFSPDRIIPDCVRAAQRKEMIVVRNPNSVRPYQHVLEAIFAYLMIAEKQYEDTSFSGCYNVGPDECGCARTGELVDLFCSKWGNASWVNKSKNDKMTEANFLRLDNSKMKKIFNWAPKWNLEQAIEKTIELYKNNMNSTIINLIMQKQIEDYLSRSI